MWNIISWIFVIIIDTILNLILAYVLYDNRIKINKKGFIISLIVATILFIFGFIINEFIIIFIPLTVLAINIDSKPTERIWIIFSIFLIVMIIQQIIILIFNPTTASIYNIALVEIENFYSTAAILIICGIIKLVKCKINHTLIQLDDIPSYFYPLIGIVVISLILSLTIFHDSSTQPNLRLKLFMILSTYFSIAFLLIAIVLFVKNNKQKELYYSESVIKDQLLAIQNDYYDSTVKNYEYMNSFKHDIQAHIRILKTLEEEKNYDELHKYLDSLQYEYQKGKVYKCSNVYISALVNSFIMEGKNNNIELMVDYSINGMITMNNIHLCSLLHNLLSNAIEAETMYPNDNKNIKLNIYSLENDLQIDISNHLEDESKIDNINKNITTKDNKRDHGIGLINIQKVINDYNGLYKTYYVGDILTISILLQDVVKL